MEILELNSLINQKFFISFQHLIFNLLNIKIIYKIYHKFFHQMINKLHFSISK